MESKDWHSAFCGATEWELKQNKRDLSYNNEFVLSKRGLRMDMLVIKKERKTDIKNEIGKLFKKHNIIEFKRKKGALTIDQYYKVNGYACLYKGLGKTVNEIPADELTVTFIREAYPRELFRMLESSGVVITERYKGIYYLTGNVVFDTQVIVTSRIDGEKHPGLKVLSSDAKEEDVVRFIREAELAEEPGDLQNVDAILQVSVLANQELYERIKRRDSKMCQALRDLMKEEIAEEVTKGRADEKLIDIKNLMKTMKWTAAQAMKALKIPVADQRKYSAMLKAK